MLETGLTMDYFISCTIIHAHDSKKKQKQKKTKRQIVGSLRSSIETAKVMAIVVRGSRWSTSDDLIKIVNEKGRLLIDAQPVGKKDRECPLFFFCVCVLC